MFKGLRFRVYFMGSSKVVEVLSYGLSVVVYMFQVMSRKLQVASHKL